MSLFGALFGGGHDKKSSSLFSGQNTYKAFTKGTVTLPSTLNKSEDEKRKKRKVQEAQEGPDVSPRERVDGAKALKRRKSETVTAGAGDPGGQSEFKAVKTKSKEKRKAKQLERVPLTDDAAEFVAPSKAAPTRVTKKVKGDKHEVATPASGSSDAARAMTEDAAVNEGVNAVKAPLGDNPTKKKKKKKKMTPEEEQEKLTRTLFVGNLPLAVKSKKLKLLFKKFGTIESVRLRSIPITEAGVKLPRRSAILSGQVAEDKGTSHAYVVFKDAGSAMAAQQMNMTEVEGHHIMVNPAARKAQRGRAASIQYAPQVTLFLGNLHYEVTDEEVIQWVQGANPGLRGSVQAVRVVRDKDTNMGKGFAYVLFKDKESLKLAKDCLSSHPLRDREVRVERCTSLAGPKSSQKKHQDRDQRNSTPQGGPGRGGPRGLLLTRPDSRPWQGVQTKGTLSKKARSGPNITKRQGGLRGASGGPMPGGRTKKRPAVEARKALQRGEKVAPSLKRKLARNEQQHHGAAGAGR